MVCTAPRWHYCRWKVLQLTGIQSASPPRCDQKRSSHWNKTLVCHLWSVFLCHAASSSSVPRYNLPWSEYPTTVFVSFFLQLMFKAPLLSLFLSHLVFKRCLGRYLSLHRLLLILLSTVFPCSLAVISFVVDLRITLLHPVMSRALSHTQGHIARSSLSFLQPCNSTKQRTLKGFSAFSTIFINMQTTAQTICVCIKRRVEHEYLNPGAHTDIAEPLKGPEAECWWLFTDKINTWHKDKL